MKTTPIHLFQFAAALAILNALGACQNHRAAHTSNDVNAEVQISETLVALHHAAATADERTYFALYAPEAVFLGTDATERWSLSEFKAFAMPYFQTESAWVYEPLERHIDVSSDGSFAWFDERLMNARLGETRGSGALRKQGDRWLIVQYNLTIPIPNELADEVAGMIREYESDSPD